MSKQAKLKLLLLAAASNELGLLLPKKRKSKRWQMRPINKYRRTNGRFLNTFAVMMEEDPEEFYKYTRLYVEEFKLLASLVKNKLTKRSCITTVTVEERLAITLSYLSQGSQMCEVARSYLRGRATVCRIIKETCNVLWDVLHSTYLKPPTPARWEEIQTEFRDRWNIPNCLGAIDGKHIAIQSPYKSGTKFYNYKHFHSIFLMAICDATYKFTFVDIGAQGICGDSGVFRNSIFGTAILNDTMNTPETDILPISGKRFPCFFVADEAFPLRRNIMCPYPRKNATRQQLIFNYRLSRGRRVIENCFGILASRWRILRRPIIGHPKTVDAIVKATTVLHNFLRTVRMNDSNINNIVDVESQAGEITPGTWRTEGNGFENLPPQGSRNYSAEVSELRNDLCDYFNSNAGAVPW